MPENTTFPDEAFPYQTPQQDAPSWLVDPPPAPQPSPSPLPPNPTSAPVSPGLYVPIHESLTPAPTPWTTQTSQPEPRRMASPWDEAPPTAPQPIAAPVDQLSPGKLRADVMKISLLCLAFFAVESIVSLIGGLVTGFLDFAEEDAGRWLAVISIVSLPLAASVFFILRGKKLVTTDITSRAPTVAKKADIGKILIVILGWQAVIIGVTILLSQLGAPSSSALDSTMSQLMGSAVGVAFIVVVGPAFEELVFRGAIMHHLAPYGINFAIVTQALLFGLYHLNVSQSIFAFVVGLLLGFVAMHFSLLWSWILHMATNAVALLLGSSWMPPWAVIAIEGVLLVAAALIVILSRDRIRSFVAEGRPLINHPMKTAWSQPLFLVVVVVGSVIACLITVLSLVVTTQ